MRRAFQLWRNIGLGPPNPPNPIQFWSPDEREGDVKQFVSLPDKIQMVNALNTWANNFSTQFDYVPPGSVAFTIAAGTYPNPVDVPGLLLVPGDPVIQTIITLQDAFITGFLDVQSTYDSGKNGDGPAPDDPIQQTKLGNFSGGGKKSVFSGASTLFNVLAGLEAAYLKLKSSKRSQDVRLANEIRFLLDEVYAQRISITELLTQLELFIG